MTGAPQADGLGSAKAPEPCGLRPSDAIPSAWQPIATAPRDGTPILVTGGIEDPEHPWFNTSPHPMVARWMPDEDFGHTWLCYTGNSFDVIMPNARHWMPIPESPPKDWPASRAEQAK